MDWEETVIKKKDCKYQPDGDRDELWADLGLVYQKIYLEGCRKQAEISFKAGIREAVDFICNHNLVKPDDDSITRFEPYYMVEVRMLKSFLKEHGIED